MQHRVEGNGQRNRPDEDKDLRDCPDKAASQEHMRLPLERGLIRDQRRSQVNR